MGANSCRTVYRRYLFGTLLHQHRHERSGEILPVATLIPEVEAEAAPPVRDRFNSQTPKERRQSCPREAVVWKIRAQFPPLVKRTDKAVHAPSDHPIALARRIFWFKLRLILRNGKEMT